MVSDNRWVATTKGIVVFLLTALLFVFWYDRDRELAESHVTAVRFGFYRVIWIEVLCGITVAWCVRKKFRFRLPDAGVLLLGGYVLLRSVYGDGMVGYRTELWISFVILYFIASAFFAFPECRHGDVVDAHGSGIGRDDLWVRTIVWLVRLGAFALPADRIFF